MNKIMSFWNHIKNQFRQEIPEQQFATWIEPLLVNEDNGQLTIIANNRFVLQWIKDRFFVKIEELAKKEGFTEVILVTQRINAKPTINSVTHNQNIPLTEPQQTPYPSKLNPQFTLDNFIAGKANQLARAAAIQVAENPGQAYNPLFIYGGVGLGKTHLIQAIGNEVVRRNPKARVKYVHAEKYVSDVVRTYQHKSFDSFKKEYHSLDVLMVDDIQFFGGKTRTQEEFFFAFNALVESHKQVIIACDSFPREIMGMEERLISRFGWGLTVAVEAPELEMRVAILINKAKQQHIDLNEDVAFFIAKHIRSHVRELEGALKRVQAYSGFKNEPITLLSAKESLKDLLALKHRQISVENIQKTVADYYKIKVADMFSKRRTRSLARPRQMAMALAKDITSLSLPDIGDAFGGRDHTTVLHACRKMQELCISDQTILRDYQALQQILSS
ncbi:MAG: chromosomal replication initiation protein DnaA [Ferrovum sp. 21-44-67]|nr:MAG: chromosomal replication initiation protein DnaA [Ferrovum sp. 21-44-67]